MAPPIGGVRIRGQTGGESISGYGGGWRIPCPDHYAYPAAGADRRARIFGETFGLGFAFGSGTPTATASTSFASGSQPRGANA